ncbi:hypothetical protein ACFZCF_17990 [Streptomyces sp. NPDC007945]|uniref:hypothetical protein n=1 Tax=Streptomyces sp. NPDC007945 TaxID=3364797 RepID=UPI0036E4F870
MGESHDAVGVALCCSAAIRLGGAVRVLVDRSGLLDHYTPIMAGVENIRAFLGGRELDDELRATAFAESWFLEARHPAEFPGRAFLKDWASLVWCTVVLARPGGESFGAAQVLDLASQAAAAWPSTAPVGDFDTLAAFERSCLREAEDRLRRDGLPALWELTEERSRQYRRVAEQLTGQPARGHWLAPPTRGGGDGDAGAPQTPRSPN